MKDIRQSAGWAEYLKSLGWESHNINGIEIHVKRILGSTMIKVQRPSLLTTETLDQIESFCKKNKTIFIKIEPSNDEDAKLLKNKGYEKTGFPLLAPSTIIINLTKPEATLWKELAKDARYSINKAERHGLKTVFLQNPDPKTMKYFHQLFLSTGKAKKFYVQPFSDLESKLKLFNQDSWLVSTMKGEELLSGSLILTHEDCIYYMHSGTSEEGRRHYANYLQLWDIIKRFKNLGFLRFDLEGIYDDRFPNFTKDWLGFTFFKKKFGGEIVRMPYPYIKYFHPALRTLRKIGKRPLPL